jgi:hypothetical protein
MEKASNKNAVRPDAAIPRPLAARALSVIRMVAGGDRFLNLYRAINHTIAALKLKKYRFWTLAVALWISHPVLNKTG